MEAESEAVGMLVAGDGLESKFAQVRSCRFGAMAIGVTGCLP